MATDWEQIYSGKYKKQKANVKKKPTELEGSTSRVISQDFANPIQARSDSSRVFKAGGGDQYEPAGVKKKREKKEVTTLRSRRKTLVDNIMETEIKQTLPQNSDKADIMQADIDAWYSELEEVSANLGQPYQRPTGDADEGGGGFWKGVGNFLSGGSGSSGAVSDEKQWKSDLVKKLATGGAVQDSSKASWTQNKYVDFKYQEELKKRENQIPPEKQTIETLMQNAGDSKVPAIGDTTTYTSPDGGYKETNVRITPEKAKENAKKWKKRIDAETDPVRKDRLEKWRDQGFAP